MDKLLTELNNQADCTTTSCFNALITAIHALLMVPYPNKLKRPLMKEYDFIVVGAGSGGSTVASRLSENPNWSVLLLEAGGEEPEITRVPGLVKTDGMFDTCVEWGFKTEPQPDHCNGKPCTYGRAKMMGGCDSHNGMWYLKGNRKLFDDYFDLGIEGWSYDEVWPYYERRFGAHELEDDGTEVDLSVERFPYIDKNVNIIMEAYKEIGITEPDRNGNIREGYRTTSKNGTRISANRLYIERVRYKRKNLHVYTETFVTKINIDPFTKRAIGVEAVITEGEKYKKIAIKARKEIFVCAGIINTAKILQLSGVGPKEVLEPFGIPVIQDLKVGYNFMNHPVLHAIDLKLTSTSTIPPDCDAIRNDILNYMFNKSGPLSSSGGFNSYLLTHSSMSNEDFPDILIAFNPLIQGLDIKDKKFCTSYYDTLNMGVMAGVTFSLGTVFLKSKDPFVPPAITIGIDDRDKHLIGEGLIKAHKIANSITFQNAGIIADNTPDPRCTHLEHGTYEYWRCAMEGNLDLWLHGMGTCSMGPKKDPNTVVDNKCKVIGVKNLRIADASICRNVTNANINSVVLMIGEKCADFCIHDHL